MRIFVLSVFAFSLFVQGVNSQTLKKPVLSNVKVSVRAYLSKHLNDFKSYEPVTWGLIVTHFVDFNQTKEAKILTDSIEFYSRMETLLNTKLSMRRVALGSEVLSDSTYLYHSSLMEFTQKYQAELKKELSIKKSEYKPKFDYYSLNHIFRAKNGYNATVLRDFSFIFYENGIVVEAVDQDETGRKFQELQKEFDELKNKRN